MVPAVSCRKDRETVSCTLKSSALRIKSSFLQTTVMFVTLAVLMPEKDNEKLGYDGQKGFIVRNRKDVGSLHCPIGLGSDSLSTS